VIGMDRSDGRERYRAVCRECQRGSIVTVVKSQAPVEDLFGTDRKQGDWRE